MRLKNKKAIITGGGAGIGRAITERFCKEGARVVIADRGSGEETSKQITGSVFHKTDISDKNSIQEMIHQAISVLGGIDIIVNNASTLTTGSIETASEEDWLTIINTDLFGYLNTTKFALPYLKKSNSGAIVNICSIKSFIAESNFLPYSTIKGAILQLTRNLAVEFGNYNIRVNAISPGTIKTHAIRRTVNKFGKNYDEIVKKLGQKTIMNRIGKPSEIANGVLFLASDEASFITGTNLIIDGGETI